MRHVLAFLGERWESGVLAGIQPEPEPKVVDLEVIDAAIAVRCPWPQYDTESIHLVIVRRNT